MLCGQWLSEIHNITAAEALNWQILHTIQHGDTPDISAYLMFQFYERVHYLDHESSFPSSKEKPGYFVGVAKNVGDKLTFKILTEDTRQLIYHSIVQSATEPNTINKHVSFDPALEEELKEPSDEQEGEEEPRVQLSGEPLPVQRITKPKKSTKTKQLHQSACRPSTHPLVVQPDANDASEDPVAPPVPPPMPGVTTESSDPLLPAPNAPSMQPEATATQLEPILQLRGVMKSPRRSPRLAAKGNMSSILQTAAWFMLATFGGLAMAQSSGTEVKAFLSHDVRVPVMENILSPNDIDVEV